MPPRPVRFRSQYDLEQPADSWLLKRRGYRIDVVPLDGGQFYWHVWLYDERVNGGLSASWIDAQQDSTRAARLDSIHRERPR